MQYIKLILFNWLLLGLFLPHLVAAAETLEVFVQKGHAQTIQALAISPNSKHLASIDSGGTIIISDYQNGMQIHYMKQSDSLTQKVMFSGDGDYIITSSYSDYINVWSVRTGKKIYSIKGDNTFTLTPDGKNIITVADSFVIKVDILTGKRREILNILGVATDHNLDDSISSIAISPDGRFLFLGKGFLTGENLILVDLAHLEYSHVIDHKRMRLRNGVSAACFSPDSKYIIIGFNSGLIEQLNIMTGKKVHTFPLYKNDVDTLSYSSNGKYLMVNYKNGHFDIWSSIAGDAATIRNQLISNLKSTQSQSIITVFSPNSKSIAAAIGSTFMKWNLSNEKISYLSSKATLEPIRDITYIQKEKLILTNQGSSVYSSRGRMINLWSSHSGNLIKSIPASNMGVSAISPDGQYLLVPYYDKNKRSNKKYVLLLQSIKTGKLVRKFNYGRAGHITSLKISADGQYALSGSSDRTMKLWKMATGKMLYSFDVKHPVQSVAFNPNGKSVVSGSELVYSDDPIKEWDISSGSLIKSFGRSAGDTMALSFSPDGHYLLTGHGFNSKKSIILWEISTGKEEKSLNSNGASIIKVAFSSNGQYALSASVSGVITRWKVSDGEVKKLVMNVYNGGQIKLMSNLNGVEFSSDGTKAYSAGDDGILRTWDIISRAELAQTVKFSNGEWVTIIPNGYFNLSSAKAIHYLSIRKEGSIYHIGQFYDKFYRPDLVQAALQGDTKRQVANAVKVLNLEKAVAKGAPPNLRFLSPDSSTRTVGETVQVKLCAEDQGGGLGKVIYRVNGVTMDIDEKKGRGAVALDDSNDCSTVLTRNLTLQPGENTITVTAYNAANEIESRPATVKMTMTGTVREKPTLYVLAVGINAYRDHSLKLTYSVDDATSMLDELQQQDKSLFKKVVVKPVLDKEATVAGIGNAFAELAKQVKPNDVFIFYAASHGLTVDGIYYMIPQEMVFRNLESVKQYAISKDQLTRWLVSIVAGKSLVLLDTCNSGDFISSRGLAEKAAVDKLMRATGRHTIVASLGTQAALEGYKGHGVFTYALLQGLAGQADSNGDHQVSVNELADYVADKVPEITQNKWGAEQFPMQSLQGRSFPVVLVQ